MARRPDVRPEGLARLCASAPVPRLSELAAHHPGTVAIVGGALRDALLGRPHEDLDVVVEGDFEAFIAALGARRGRQPAPIGDRFQETHRCVWAGAQVDVSASQGSLLEDLSRRDFTVNAMALPLPPSAPDIGALVDPDDGLADLRAGRIRCARPEVLDDDPLRLLRAVRYGCTLPGFAIDPATEAEIRRRAGRLDEAAAERVQAEWRLLLAGRDWIGGLETAAELGLPGPGPGHPDELPACRAWADVGDELAGEAGRARLAAFIMDLSRSGAPDSPADLAAHFRRRRWPRRLVSAARAAASWALELRDTGPEGLARWALDSPEVADLAARLAEAAEPEAAAAAGRLRRFARRALEARWVTGDDLVRWGVPEGPALGALLQEIAIGQVSRRWREPGPAREWARQRAAARGRRESS